MIYAEVYLKEYDTVLPVKEISFSDGDWTSPHAIVSQGDVWTLLGEDPNRGHWNTDQWDKMRAFGRKYSCGRLSTAGVVVYIVKSTGVKLVTKDYDGDSIIFKTKENRK